MKRAPFDGGAEIEIRQVFASEDFGEALTPELREQEMRLRAAGYAAHKPDHSTTLKDTCHAIHDADDPQGYETAAPGTMPPADARRRDDEIQRGPAEEPAC